ncbi:UNVERIFIED_CONTAM: tc1a [Trichonephila clavipes]
MNSSMTFSAAWPLSSETMAEVTLEAASQTQASSMVMFTASRWSHTCLAALTACIRNRRTGPSLGVKIWGVIVYKSRPPLVRIDDTRRSAHYFYSALRPMTLPFIRALRNLTFRQDNARPHAPGNIRTFLGTENVQLLPWTSHYPDLSPIENVWSRVADDRLVTIRQSLRLMSCGPLWKLHGHLYLCMPYNLCFTQYPSL